MNNNLSIKESFQAGREAAKSFQSIEDFNDFPLSLTVDLTAFKQGVLIQLGYEMGAINELLEHLDNFEDEDDDDIMSRVQLQARFEQLDTLIAEYIAQD